MNNKFLSASAFALVHSLLVFSCHSLSFDPSTYAEGDVLTVDVAIIGGGATGSYAGVSLSDLGKKVVVIEKQARLGGQTDTYFDPATNTAFDFGVQRYQNDDVTLNFFKRLGLSTANDFPGGSNETVYADFETAEILDWSPGTNFTSYIEQLEKYPWMVYTSDVQGPIPEDLYITMDDFIAKYNIGDIAYQIFEGYGSTFSDSPSFGVLVDTGLAEFTSISTNRVVGGNGEIYEAALSVLGSNVLFNSTVTAAQRSDSLTECTYLVVDTPTGQKLIEAARLLLTIPTTENNMAPFSPDEREGEIFSGFYGTGYYTGVVQFSSAVLPTGIQYSNAAPDQPYHIPPPPAVTFLQPSTVASLYKFQYYTADLLSVDQARAESLAAIQSFVDKLTSSAAVDIELVDFSTHSPFHPRLTAEAIKAGYWDEMYKLQGYRNTWYTGAQFLPGSSQLWNYTASLLPVIIAGL